MIVSTQPDGVTGAEARAHDQDPGSRLGGAVDSPGVRLCAPGAASTKRSIEATLRRTASHRTIDIVHDLGIRHDLQRHQRVVRHTRSGLVDRDGRRLAFLSPASDQIEPEWLAAIKGVQARRRRLGDMAGLVDPDVRRHRRQLPAAGGAEGARRAGRPGVPDAYRHADRKSQEAAASAARQPAGGVRLAGGDVHGSGQPECPAGRGLLRPGPHAAAGSRELGRSSLRRPWARSSIRR